MNDIRGVHVRTVRKWNIGRIKFNPAVQREIIVGGRCLIPGNHHDRFHEVTGSTKKKKSASRTIHFQFSNSFYFSIVIYTKLTVQNLLPIVFYTFPSSPKEITIFLILFTSNVTLHTRRILYF